MLSSLMPLANVLGSSHETDRTSANAIEKALSVLVLLLRHDQPLGTVQISRMTGFHKATTSRILTTLERFGLVVQNDRSRKYLIGPLGFQFGTTQLSMAMATVARLAQPGLIRLCEQFDSPAVLDLWIGRQSVVAAVEESPGQHRALPQHGSARPLQMTAGGRAILACLDRNRVRKLVAPAVQPVTEESLLVAARLAEDLTAICANGFAQGPSGALAAALVDAQGLPIGAISLLRPVDREADLREMASTLTRAARRLSVEIVQANILALDEWHYDGE